MKTIRIDKPFFSIAQRFSAKARLDISRHTSTETISLYVAEAIPDLFTEKTCTVPTLSAERSFWKKQPSSMPFIMAQKCVTACHAIITTPKDGSERHNGEGAWRRCFALAQVVRNKSVFFRDAKASYETAKIGSLRLVPEGAFLQTLQKDYAAMSEMFMGEYPTFNTIIEGLAALEKRLNSFR